MNSKDWDFVVSRMFGESDADYMARNRTAKAWDSEIEARRAKGRRLGMELDQLHNLKAVLDNYVGFLRQFKHPAGRCDYWEAEAAKVDKRIEEVQNERISLWKSIKEMEQKRARLG